MVTVAPPVPLGAQLGFTAVADITKGTTDGGSTETLPVAVRPVASITVTEYVPGVTLRISDEMVPLLH